MQRATTEAIVLGSIWSIAARYCRGHSATIAPNMDHISRLYIGGHSATVAPNMDNISRLYIRGHSATVAPNMVHYSYQQAIHQRP